MDYRLIKNTFYNYYKSLMDFSRLMIEANNRTYEIKVLRDEIDIDTFKVTVLINNQDITDDKFILNSEEANDLIDAIRLDFKDNHYITYSSTNSKDLTQTMQNTNFTLIIKLLNENELEEAIKFNDEINRDGSRHKALIRK